MDIYEIRLKNAQALAANMKLADVADRLGKQPTQVSRFMGKNPTKNIGPQIARELEKVFGMEHGWLDKEHQDEGQKRDAGLNFAPTKVRKIPVKSLAQIINREQGSAEVSAPDTLPDRTVAYALVNDSMEGPGRKYIPRDSTLYIIEGAQPEPGKVVLASLNGNEVIGEYSMFAGRPHLRPYNAQYPAVDISDAQIGGVLAGYYCSI